MTIQIQPASKKNKKLWTTNPTKDNLDSDRRRCIVGSSICSF